MNIESTFGSLAEKSSFVCKPMSESYLLTLWPFIWLISWITDEIVRSGEISVAGAFATEF